MHAPYIATYDNIIFPPMRKKDQNPLKFFIQSKKKNSETEAIRYAVDLRQFSMTNSNVDDKHVETFGLLNRIVFNFSISC